MTQHQRIISFIKAHGSITPMEAFANLGITKLSTRIGEIERKGLASFSRTRETSLNRYGEEANYMRYRLKEDEQ